MPDLNSPKAFHAAALAAFPFSHRAMAGDAAQELAPMVDDSYRKRSLGLEVRGERIYVPERLHFSGLDPRGTPLADLSVAARCLVTRATDGHMRRQALVSILAAQSPWSIPFIVLLAGDYVLEIVEDVRAAVPTLDRDLCAEFVRENRTAIRAINARAVSYWNRHHRTAYPERKDYPAVVMLRQLEAWAQAQEPGPSVVPGPGRAV